MMSIKIKTISMVRIPPPKCRKYLFHVALTNKNQTNGSVRLVFVCMYFFCSAKNPALNSGVLRNFLNHLQYGGKKILRALCLRMIENLRRGTLFHNHAVGNQNHPVRYIAGKTHFMGYHDHGHAALSQFFHHA